MVIAIKKSLCQSSNKSLLLKEAYTNIGNFGCSGS